MKFLKKHYNDLLAGHLAIKKTYNTFCRKYFWFNMYKQIDKYCTSCLIYQGARVIFEKQLGESQRLTIPTKTLVVFSMNFITGLLENVKYKGVHDAIFVVIDKLSNLCHYISYRSDMTERLLDVKITQEVI